MREKAMEESTIISEDTVLYNIDPTWPYNQPQN